MGGDTSDRFATQGIQVVEARILSTLEAKICTLADVKHKAPISYSRIQDVNVGMKSLLISF